MKGSEPEDLLDTIYEAAVVPERWPAVLDGLAGIADGMGTLILTRNDMKSCWLGTGRAKDLYEESLATGWQDRNPRAPRLFAARHPGFMNDLDVFTLEEIHSEPYFTELLHPQGMGWGAATAIEVPSGDMIAFDVERSYARGPVERDILNRLDGLRPHLARASIIACRLAFDRARRKVETLRLIGLPAAAIGPRGLLLTANEPFEELVPSLFEDRAARLTIADRDADALFAQACECVSRGAGLSGATGSIPVPAFGGRPPTIVHVVPIRGAAGDVFSFAAALVVVTAVEPKKVPSAEVLQGLFDLTPAEVRVARAVAAGVTLGTLAAECGLSRETIRSQLKGALSKTGVHRQAELARLLTGVKLPG